MNLEVRLERPLPAAIPAGVGTAVFCTGVCVAAGLRLVGLEVLVGGERRPLSAFGMPRPDAPGGGGFWGTVPIPPADQPGRVELSLAARVTGGRELTAPLGSIEVVAPEPAHHAGARPGLLAVCMATFEPDPDLFAAQISSLREQSESNWVCVISDDCSRPEQFATIERVVGEDPRFVVSRSERRLGFYRNFERALRMAPADASLIALCDQDDRWHPDKLTVLRAALGDAVLVYSDQRLVDAGGTVLRETFWRGRRNNHDNLASMLVANTITGAATLMRRSLLEIVLPFPDTPGFQFHDHWLAVAALAAGEVAYVDRPLYDYVQHPGAVFGDVTHGTRDRQPRGTWRAGYFYGYLAREAQARTLLARCGSSLTPRKRRVLERFCAADSSLWALLWLLARGARTLAGRTETLGTEIELAQGLVWKRLAVLRARLWRRPGGPLGDTAIPPPHEFVQRRLRRWRSRVLD